MADAKNTLTGKELAVGYALAAGFILLVGYGINSLGSDDEDASTSYTSSSSKPDVVDAAYSLCGIMQNTNLVSQCEVNGWESAVDVRIDTVGTEAIQMCSDTTNLISSKTSLFSGKGWKLRIFSPFSGDRPLATCTLR